MLTPKMKELLTFIDQSIRDNGGICPTYDEMAKGSGVKSKSRINRLVRALEERGFIRRIPGRHRAIEVVRLPGVDRVEWQPIETAPEFGWMDVYPVLTGFGRKPTKRVREVFKDGDTFICDGADLCQEDAPTHWRERPSPPVTQEKS